MTRSNFSLLIVFYLMACTDTDFIPACPENNDRPDCIAEDLVGEWVFIDLAENLEADACLSRRSPNRTEKRTLTFTKSSNGGDINLVKSSSRTQFNIWKRAEGCSIVTVDKSVVSALFFDDHMILKGSNRLEVTSKYLFVRTVRVYRRAH